MKKETRNVKFIAIVLGALMLATLVPFLASPQPALAKGSTPRHEGFVQSMPASGYVGTWVVGGKTFKATASTQIDQEEGPLTVGVCAKVKFKVVNGRNQALEIDSEPATDCR